MTKPSRRTFGAIPGRLCAVLVAITLLLPAVPARAAADAAATTLFLNLTSDDQWTAEMALNYASMVRQAGHPVVVFLNVRGVRLAHKGAPHWRSQVGAASPTELLEKLIASGATVYVCGMCAKNVGLDQSDWLPGTKPGSAETIAVQMAPDTRVMSY